MSVVTEVGGIRRTGKIAGAVAENLKRLDGGGWSSLWIWCERHLAQRALPPESLQRELEEAAADHVSELREFGPRQSQNFWQILGLTRYTFVLDSRVQARLTENLDLPSGRLTPRGFGDRAQYRFVSDLLSDLCQQAGVLPCMFEAVMCGSFDKDTEWTGEVLY